jgi:hypothetical protein
VKKGRGLWEKEEEPPGCLELARLGRFGLRVVLEAQMLGRRQWRRGRRGRRWRADRRVLSLVRTAVPCYVQPRWKNSVRRPGPANPILDARSNRGWVFESISESAFFFLFLFFFFLFVFFLCYEKVYGDKFYMMCVVLLSRLAMLPCLSRIFLAWRCGRDCFRSGERDLDPESGTDRTAEARKSLPRHGV